MNASAVSTSPAPASTNATQHAAQAKRTHRPHGAPRSACTTAPSTSTAGAAPAATAKADAAGPTAPTNGRLDTHA
jgi:hypothetical protein